MKLAAAGTFIVASAGRLGALVRGNSQRADLKVRTYERS